jgi:hypothetical protein
LRGRLVARGNPETDKAFVVVFALFVKQSNISREGRPQNPIYWVGRPYINDNDHSNDKVVNGIEGFCACPQNDRQPRQQQKQSQLLDCHADKAARNDGNDHGNSKVENGNEGFCACPQNDIVTTTTTLSLHLPQGAREHICCCRFYFRTVIECFPRRATTRGRPYGAIVCLVTILCDSGKQQFIIRDDPSP